jgi:hypothetical protein
MSYFIEGLKVLLGIWAFLCFFFIVAIIMAMWPQKAHRRQRMMWHCPDELLPQDYAVRIVEAPYDQEIVNEITSDAVYDWKAEEWEARFADEGSVW